MPTLSKRTKIARNLIIKPAYSLDESIKLLKQTATTKFIESAEAHFCLNLDTKYSDQQLRTTITLPRGTGKEVKIAVLIPDSIDSKIKPFFLASSTKSFLSVVKKPLFSIIPPVFKAFE